MGNIEIANEVLSSFYSGLSEKRKLELYFEFALKLSFEMLQEGEEVGFENTRLHLDGIDKRIRRIR